MKLNPKTYKLKQAEADLLALNQKIIKATEQYNFYRKNQQLESEKARKATESKIYIKSIIKQKDIKNVRQIKKRKELLQL